MPKLFLMDLNLYNIKYHDNNYSILLIYIVIPILTKLLYVPYSLYIYKVLIHLKAKNS